MYYASCVPIQREYNNQIFDLYTWIVNEIREVVFFFFQFLLNLNRMNS